METKTCSRCSVELPVTEFYHSRGRPANPCKGCRKAHRAPRKATDRAYEQRSRERRNALRRENARKHYLKNRQRKIAKVSAYIVKRLAEDPVYKLRMKVSKFLREQLKQRGTGKKGHSSWEHLPYTVEELAAHLESRFEVGMTWENQGEWHIDHIRPQSHFKFELGEHPEVIADPSITSWDAIENPMLHPDVARCNALSNLRPLWASENVRRGDRASDNEILLEMLQNLEGKPQ